MTVRAARQRIADLFELAAREWGGGHPGLSNRYVELARKVGARYNVRIPPDYRELYCRSCSVYWVEGRTVRTRLRHQRRVRTCLICGAARRSAMGLRRPPRAPAPPGGIREAPEAGEAPAELPTDLDAAADEFGTEGDES